LFDVAKKYFEFAFFYLIFRIKKGKFIILFFE